MKSILKDGLSLAGACKCAVGAFNTPACVMQCWLLCLAAVGVCSVAISGPVAIEDAQEALWKFVSPQGILYDYLGEVPTPKDCAECRPNGVGYWSPLENGPMFTGPFLQAMVLRAGRTKSAQDKERCRVLAEGLLRAASVSEVPGFVCRGIGSDGKCHYPIGGCDQTTPWFLGLDAYLHSEFCAGDFKLRIVAKMREVGEALAGNNWSTPAEGVFQTERPSDLRIQSLPFRGAVQYLFILRVLADATGEPKWKEEYLRARDGKYQRKGSEHLTRLEICEAGCGRDAEMKKGFKVNPTGLWIYVGCAQGCLAALADREEEADVARRYRNGLEKSAAYVRSALGTSKLYPNVAEHPLKYAQWRAGWTWRAQSTLAEVMAAANKTNANWKLLGNRKTLERRTVTAPLSAAAICAYAGLYGDEVMKTLRHYDYSTIALSEFYAAPLAYELLLSAVDRKQKGTNK